MLAGGERCENYAEGKNTLPCRSVSWLAHLFFLAADVVPELTLARYCSGLQQLPVEQRYQSDLASLCSKDEESEPQTVTCCAQVT